MKIKGRKSGRIKKRKDWWDEEMKEKWWEEEEWKMGKKGQMKKKWKRNEREKRKAIENIWRGRFCRKYDNRKRKKKEIKKEID